MTEASFEGVITDTVHDATPWWPSAVRPRESAPNVVLVVLDDVGFGQLGCYGSSIATPAIDALADDGVRYTNYHVTALCSTTRATLLTGRNHHSVGVGFLADFDTGFPGYRGAITPAAATVAEMLSGGGYGTYLSGKWHLTPPSHMTPAGPFHQWPTGRGFDRYYGFLWGEDDQYHPELWRDREHVEPPDRPDYHLSADLVDQAQRFVADHVSATPERPFFLTLAFGACHAPHQAPAEHIDRYAGAFDHGWDVERERVLARQIELGIVPPDTRLPERNPEVRAWDDLPEEERRLCARMQEVFAGFMSHTDEQIGRLVDFLRSHGLLDDTVILVMSDNGASGEGGASGSANEYRYFLGLEDPLEDTLAAYDDLGGPAAHNHYPSGWAQAGNTPLKRFKKHTFGGGVRAPLVVHWPAGIRDTGGRRGQFHHAVDVTPTILELAGVAAPQEYRGVPQLPLHGTSMAYTFDDAAAAPRHETQYFETAGHRGIYHRGLKLVADHVPGRPFAEDRFELYDLDADFSETHDLAADRPEDAAALLDLWWDEARRYGVLPLDDRMQTRVEARDPATDRDHFRLLPGVRLSNGPAGPNFAGREFVVTARLDGPPGDGVLLAYGRRAAGFALFVQDARLVLDLNLAGDHHLVESPRLPAAPRTLGASVTPGPDGADLVLFADGREIARGRAPQGMPAGLGCLSTQCGHNSPSPVSPRYQAPFACGPALHHVDIEFPARDRGAASEALWAAATGSD